MLIFWYVFIKKEKKSLNWISEILLIVLCSGSLHSAFDRTLMLLLLQDLIGCIEIRSPSRELTVLFCINAILGMSLWNKKCPFPSWLVFLLKRNTGQVNYWADMYTVADRKLFHFSWTLKNPDCQIISEKKLIQLSMYDKQGLIYLLFLNSCQIPTTFLLLYFCSLLLIQHIFIQPTALFSILHTV